MFALAIAAGLGVAPAARADPYPTRPVLVGFAAGGAVDVVARALGEQLSQQLGLPFIVESRPASWSGPARARRAPPTSTHRSAGWA